MAGNKLNAKQERFCQEYMVDLNATQAAIRAGYSEKTSYSIGQENLKKPEIADRIAELKAKRQERVQVNQDDVLKAYLKIANFDPRKLYHENGVPKRPQELDDDTAMALSGIEPSDHGLKYKASDKKGALDSLARHLGMFKDSLAVERVVKIVDLTGDK